MRILKSGCIPRIYVSTCADCGAEIEFNQYEAKETYEYVDIGHSFVAFINGYKIKCPTEKCPGELWVKL